MRHSPRLPLVIIALLLPTLITAQPALADNNTPKNTAHSEQAAKKPRRKNTAPATVVHPPLRLELPTDHTASAADVHQQHQYLINLPDLLAKPEKTAGRLQFGGSLILNEENDPTKPEDRKRSPAQQYLDSVQGAEIGITIKTP